MSYAYPVYEDRVNKTNVRFYHCSDKKSDVRIHKTKYAPGTILDEDMNPIYTPAYSVVDDATPNHTRKLAILDCTILNLYFMDGEWYMGTKNSWNIRKLQDFTPTTYGEFFDESLSYYPKFSYDKLDTTKMYTVLFTNPRCHLLAKDYKVYVYTSTDVLAEYFEVLPEEKLFDNYILVDDKNTVYVQQSKFREECLRKLYSNRRRLYSKEHDLAIAKTLISAMCKCSAGELNNFVNYVAQHRNIFVEPVLKNVLEVFKHFNDNRTEVTNMLGVSVPAILTKTNKWPYHEKNIGFFVNLYRAYTTN